VDVTVLPTLETARISPAAIRTAAAAVAELGFRIQAGAFSDEANARRAVAQLSVAGVATVEPIQRNGVTLYRVILPGPADEAQAYAIRDKAAAAGFSDARVVRPF
jgi:rare lipoprotein A